MRLTIKVPYWLIGWMFKDLERRASLNGKAGWGKRWGRFEIEKSVEQPREGNDK